MEQTKKKIASKMVASSKKYNFEDLLDIIKKNTNKVAKLFKNSEKLSDINMAMLIELSKGNLDVLEAIFLYQIFPSEPKIPLVPDITNDEILELNKRKIMDIKRLFRLFREANKKFQQASTSYNSKSLLELKKQIEKDIVNLPESSRSYLKEAFYKYPELLNVINSVSGDLKLGNIIAKAVNIQNTGRFFI